MKIYNGDLYDTQNIPSTSYLQINSCGISNECMDDCLSFRKNGRLDYHILYTAQGKCDVLFGEKHYTLLKGGFVIYPPKMPQSYKAYAKTRTLWIHFNGNAAENILAEYNITPGVYSRSYSQAAENIILRLIKEHSLAGESYISNEKGILLSLLCEIGRIINSKSEPKKSGIIDECVEFLTINFNLNISTDELAAKYNMSKSRFMHLFKDITGTSPHHYQQLLRINNSKLLLETTSMTIAEISRAIGFDDQLYFSRLFKKHTGVSPIRYRETD